MQQFERSLSSSELQAWHVDKLSPMRIIGTIAWARRIDASTLRRAWREVTSERLLLRCGVMVDAQSGARPKLVDLGDAVAPLDIEEAEGACAEHAEGMANAQVERELGAGEALIRGVAAIGSRDTTLIFTAHHMHLDARAGTLILERLAQAVAGRRSSTPMRTRVEGRSVEDLLGPRKRAVRDRIREASYLFGLWRDRVSLRPVYERTEDAPLRVRFSHSRRELGPEQTAFLSDSARALDLSVGSLVTAAYLRAIASFEGTELPATIPLSEGVGLHRYFDEPVAEEDLGMHGCMFKTMHTIGPDEDIVQIARRVRERDKRAVDAGLAVHGVRLFGSRGWKPSVERALRDRVRRRAFTFSNLGRLGAGIEDPDVVRMDLTSTLSVLASALLAIYRFRDRLVLQFTYATHAIKPAQAETLLDSIVGHLATLESPRARMEWDL